MESHNISRPDEGFTLIEIIIVIGLLGMIAAVGLFISFDFYKSYAYNSELSTIVSVLQKARSRSLNNVNEKRHGVHFQASPLTYVIFECSGCTGYPGASSTDQPVGSSYSVSITAPALPFDAVFDQLSGRCISPNCFASELAMTVAAGVKSENITVNSEGQIDW